MGGAERANRIVDVRAREVLDSRGNPTVEADVALGSGIVGRASVPSGASTGRHEAHERRDGDPTRHAGKGVRDTVARALPEVRSALHDRDPRDQAALDAALISLDGTPDKSRLGANVLLAASLASARAAAIAESLPLYRWIATLAGHPRDISLPLPMVNIFSGGLHANRNIDMQDFLAVPIGAADYPSALDVVCNVYRAAYRTLDERGLSTLLADEGGFGPALDSNEAALRLLVEVIERAGYVPGRDVAIAIDVASTHFYRDGRYHLAGEGRGLTPVEMSDLLADWATRFPVISIEDGLAEDDWDGWRLHTDRIGDRVQVLGDDLFVTNPTRLDRGLAEGVGNAILVKMNQIGTLSEALDVVARAKAGGYRTVISARSGETEDDFLADLAVGTNGGQIKIGSVSGSSRLAKYNQLLRISAEIGDSVPFARRSIFAG